MRLVEIKDFNALNDNKSLFLSNCQKETRSIQKTCGNVKKQ